MTVAEVEASHPPAFCSFLGELVTTSDSDISMEKYTLIASQLGIL